MKLRRGLGAAIAIACATPACATNVEPSASIDEAIPANPATWTPVPEIKGGKPVNSTGDVVAAMFPQSTVALITPNVSLCTGVILSQTKILTASHCHPDTTTLVEMYGSTGFVPIGALSSTPRTVASVAMPPGVTGDIGLTGAGLKDSSGNFADLAMLTLSAPISSSFTWNFADVAPANAFADDWMDSSWAVGVGEHDGNPNKTVAMDWVPVRLGSHTDDAGRSTPRSSTPTRATPAARSTRSRPTPPASGASWWSASSSASRGSSTRSRRTSTRASSGNRTSAGCRASSSPRPRRRRRRR